jgi:hypothetical protein
MIMFCKLHQWHVSRSLDDAQPLPKATARHVAKCDPCRQFHQDSLAVARRLTERPAPSPVTVSPDLHDRILLRCGLAGARSVRHGALANWRGHLRLPLALAAAAVAAMLAIAGARYFASPEPTPPPRGPGRIATPNVPKPIVLPAVDPGADFPVAVERALRKPVEDELTLLRGDAKVAVTFLLACIPAHIDLGEELTLWTQDGEKKSP